MFCELLFELGSVKAACEQMDITLRTGRRIQEKNKELILSMTNSELSSLAYSAVNTYRKALTEDEQDHKIEAKLKAADSVLDRVGASKRNVVEHQGEDLQPVILMPAKNPVETPEILVDPE